MRIEYWAVLVRAWGRMKDLLFHPFDPVKWLILGFCAWVAGLLDGHGGGNGTRWNAGGGHGGGPSGSVDPESILEGLRQALGALRSAWEWLMGHWGVTLVVFIGIPILLAFILTLLWLTSRFKLIFLDNLVRGRAEVVEPWRRLGKLGDSLFAFRVAFAFGAVLVAGVLVALLLGLGVVSLASNAKGWGVAGIIVAGMLFFVFMIAVAYLALFLESFVVPIMYRHNLTVIPAWKAFLPWLSAEPVNFVLYGLFVLLLTVGAMLGIGVIGFATCCIGFFLLMLPYVGTVLLLPLIVAYRYLSLEFLAQFHSSLSVFPTPPTIVPEPTPAEN